MSWLNKLKNILKENEPEVKNIKPEQVRIELLGDKVNDKIKHNYSKNNELKKEITENIASFKNEMKASIEILEKVSLSGRKEHEKIKQVVLENLSLYVAQVKRLISQLENLEPLELSESLIKLNTILNEFDRA